MSGVPDAAAIAVAVVIADIVHELRRAAIKPISRINRGIIASRHDAALAFGWLAPAPASAHLLALTPSGKQALRDAWGARE